MQFFDWNYTLGNGMFAGGGYASPEAILAQMDYLGIDRALVWSAEARDWSGINANRELLEKLAPFAGRLFPAFVITPRDYYENGTLDFYREQCAAGRVRAFRICPKGARSPVRECEFVLAELAEFAPVVQIDTRELAPADYPQVEEMAKKFPQITFVLGQRVWCDLDVVLNLMKRCKNVNLDTSWLHVRGTLEMIAARFGAERLLFATGHQSQYGAAVGALMHAELAEPVRERIAHGNAEALLKLAPLSRKLANPPAILAEKPLWCAFARGEKLEGVEVIDAHTHQAGPASSGYLLADTDVEQALPGMIRVMDRCGFHRSITVGSRALYCECRPGNREFARQAAPYRDRFYGWWAFNPHNCAGVPEAELDEAFAGGFFVGFKILPAYWGIPLDDARFHALWQYAEKHALPVLIHTWGDVNLLEPVVPRYPHVKFIIAHSGGTDWGRDDAVKLAKANSNVYFETCGTFCSSVSLAKIIPEFGPDRFIFGTDAGLHNAAYELAAFLSMPLPDAVLRPSLGQSVLKLIPKNALCVDKH